MKNLILSSIKNYWLINNRINLWAAFLGSAFLFFITACNNPTDIGSDLLQEENNINTVFSDTMQVEFLHQLPDSVYLDPLAGAVMLGEIQEDPIFGKYSASFYVEMLMTESYLRTANQLYFDSLIFSIVYTSSTTAYGPDSAKNNLAVYEVLERISDREKIDSETTYATELNPLSRLSNIEFHPEIRRYDVSDTAQATPLAPIISFDMSYSSLAQRIFQTVVSTDESEDVTNTAMQEVFKGLYVTPESSLPNNAITSFSLGGASTRMTLYFREELGVDSFENRTIVFRVDNVSGHFTHDYLQSASEDVKEQIGNPELFATDKLYAQGMDGIDLIARLPYKSSLPDAIINKAELLMTHRVDEADSLYAMPSYINVRLINRYTGAIKISNDYNLNLGRPPQEVSEDGVDKLRYGIDINYYLQDYLEDKSDSLDLLIAVHPFATTPDRAVFEGPQSVYIADRPKLRLFYVPLAQ